LGQKVHPVGFRLGISKDWQAKWYADKHYTELLQEDIKIRKAIESNYAADDISRVEIERAANQVTVTIYTARPGIVIGRGGQRVDEMRLILERVSGKRVRLNILEIARPEQDAYLIARGIVQQILRRISHRRAMKQAISRAMDGGAQGIKVKCSGRLTGSEYSRNETLYRGRVPLHTLRADIDFAIAVAHTSLGCTGVKVWIYKGDIIPEREKLPIEAPIVAPLADKEGIEESTLEEGEEAKVEVKEDIVEEAEVEKKPAADGKASAKRKTIAKQKPKVGEEAKVEREAGVKEMPEAEMEAKKKTVAKQKPKVGEEVKVEKEASVKETPEAETKAKKKTVAKQKPKMGEEAKVEKEAGVKETPEAETKAKKKTTAKRKSKAEGQDDLEEHEKKEG
jgi:small subunit ribosomal protein S3